MLKAMNSPYMLGERSRSTKYWMKLKPEYMDTLAGYLDLIVLGGYYSSSSRRGGRSGLISHFLLGVKADSVSRDTPEEKLQFHTLCKVGTGYNVQTIKDINKRLMEQSPSLHHHHPKDRNAVLPKHFCGWKPSKTDDIPDVWFDPKRSIVFEICGAELQNTEQFLARVTVRFPRVKEVRFDKDWHDIMSLSELKSLKWQISGSSQDKRRKNVEGVENSKRQSKKLRMASLYSLPDTSNVAKTAEILQGYTFCIILSQTIDVSHKEDLAARIVRLGGKLVANPRVSGYCSTKFFVITPKLEGDKLKNICKNGLCDVISVLWLKEVELQRKFVHPYIDDKYFFSMRADKRLEWMDQYGDMYFRNTTPETLARTFERMDKNNDQNSNVAATSSACVWKSFFSCVEDDEDGEVGDALFRDKESLFSDMIFAKLVFYFELDATKEDISELNTALPFQIRMLGGTIVDCIDDPKITHVVRRHNKVLDRNAVRLQESDSFDGSEKNNMVYRQYVSYGWVRKCISSKALVSTLIISADKK